MNIDKEKVREAVEIVRIANTNAFIDLSDKETNAIIELWCFAELYLSEKIGEVKSKGETTGEFNCSLGMNHCVSGTSDCENQSVIEGRCKYFIPKRFEPASKEEIEKIIRDNGIRIFDEVDVEELVFALVGKVGKQLVPVMEKLELKRIIHKKFIEFNKELKPTISLQEQLATAILEYQKGGKK